MGLVQSGKLNVTRSAVSSSSLDIVFRRNGKSDKMTMVEPISGTNARSSTESSDESNMIRLIDLVDELQEHIYMYCSVDDIKSLSLTSSEYNEAMQRSLLHTVNASAQLAHNEVVLLNRLDNLEETVVLRIHSHPHRYYRSAANANCYASYFSSIPAIVHQKISKLPRLLKLDLSDRVGGGGSLIDDRAMNILCGGLLLLKTLILRGSKVSSIGCSYLTSLNNLTELDVLNCRQIGVEGVVHISNIVTLLSLPIDNITSPGLFHIVNMGQLEALNISLFPFLVDSAWHGICKLKNLRTLQLNGSVEWSVTDSDMAQIRQLTELRSFSCILRGITDRGFLSLSSLMKLKSLKFQSNTHITDKAFLSVCLNAKLAHINVSGCANISEKAVHAVKAANPKVEIII